MTASNFSAALAEVFRHEGGYINHPKDPGGETNFGISKRAYPNENIRAMTPSRAANIYRRDYWNKVRGDEMPDGIDLVAFDPSVNSGVSRGSKWLQSALGVTQDGKIGMVTVGKAQAEPNGVAVIQRACAARMGFLRGLRTWGTFGKGWTRRVVSVEATAVAMNTRSAKVVKAEGDKAGSQSASQATGAAGAGVAGGAGGTTDMLTGLPDIAVYGIVGLAVIVALVLVSKSRVNRARADAYKRQAARMTA